MASQVAGDLYESITGQIFEIGRQLRQQNGYPFDPLALKSHLQAAIEGRFYSQVVSSFRFDKSKDGWKLLENTPRRLVSANIEGVSFLKGKEAYINGEEIVRRAVGLNVNYGQEDAEYLLEHKDEIPAELRKFYLIFPGTIWRGSDGYYDVPYLRWFDGQWFLHFFWLDRGGDFGACLVRPRKPACR